MAYFSFPASCRIKTRDEFSHIMARGKRLEHATGRLYWVFNNLPSSRLGVSVSRKTGNAVRRNRMKRVAREAFRLNRGRIARGRDIVIVFNKFSAYSPAEITALFDRAHFFETTA